MDFTFWSEPVNAITNAAFVIAGLLVVFFWRRSKTKHPAVLFLGIWICVIGIGSFLLHTFATGWAAAADVIPILVFILVYLFLALRNYLTLPLWACALITVAFVPVSAVITPLAAPLIGSSAGYASAFLAIVIVGVLMLPRERVIANGLILTGVIFAVSIAFRTIDEPVCSAFSLGTHFLWHILNAVVLYRLAMIFLRKKEEVAAA